MALKRKDKTVVKKEEITADYDDIISFHVNVPERTVDIELVHGNKVGDLIEVISTEIVSIKDEPEHAGVVTEELTIEDGIVTLLSEPSTMGMVTDPDGEFIFSGKDWILDGQVLTFKELADGDVVRIEYHVMIPASDGFSSMANASVDHKENAFNNIKAILWGKLIELGFVDGDII